MNQKDEQQLIKRVFSTPDGEKLLEVMMEQYVLAPLFSRDPYELASRAGVQDFVTNLVIQSGATEDE